MAAIRFLLVFSFLIILSSCGENGGDDLSELSGKVFKALKSGDQAKISDCEPSVKDMEKAIEMNLEDSTRTKEARHEAAINKTASMQLNMDQAFSNVVAGAKQQNIDWRNAQLKDFRYVINEHVEDYKDALVHLVITSGKNQAKLKFKAYLFGNRWYLAEILEWEN